MDKSTWGPAIWRSIHYTAVGYPNEPTELDKSNYKAFYLSFSNILPCKECRQHYKRHLQQMPICESLDSKRDLFKWTVELHNTVNVSLGKSRMSVQDAWELYNTNQKPVPFIKILLALIIIYLVFPRGIF
jgi:hypothetical protein